MVIAGEVFFTCRGCNGQPSKRHEPCLVLKGRMAFACQCNIWRMRQVPEIATGNPWFDQASGFARRSWVMRLNWLAGLARGGQLH